MDGFRDVKAMPLVRVTRDVSSLTQPCLDILPQLRHVQGLGKLAHPVLNSCPVQVPVSLDERLDVQQVLGPVSYRLENNEVLGRRQAEAQVTDLMPVLRSTASTSKGSMPREMSTLIPLPG